MQITLVLFCLLASLSCSTRTRQLFFDIQPPTAQELAEKERQEQARREATLAALESQQTTEQNPFSMPATDDKQTRPLIESTRDWEEASQMLPKDYKKKVDWSAALEQDLIRPRPGADPLSPYAAIFQWDFIIAADKPKNEAFFPHSAHTKWLGCKNCHTTIFPYRRNPATMKEMRKGASCGTCHGKDKVAFSLSQCKRCHLKR